LIVVIAMVSILASAMVYARKTSFSERPLSHRFFLAALRSIGLFFLLILLLNPIFRQLTEHITRPIIVYAQDNSQSMVSKGRSELDDYLGLRNQLWSALESDFDLVKVQLDEQTRPMIVDSFNGLHTDLNSLFDYCTDKLDLRNVKAIVLASDGIYNKGKNPIYHSLLKQTPVFTIPLGDTSQKKDLAVYNLYHSELVHAFEQFFLQVDMKAFNGEGENSELMLQEYKNNAWATLETRSLSIDRQNYFKSFDFTITAGTNGHYRYRVVSKILPNESNASNNQREFFIEVRDAKVKVLIQANSPHPDVAAIKSALLVNRNYTVDFHFGQDLPNNLNEYKAVVLHQLPSALITASRIKSWLQTNKIPLVYILGEQTDINGFHQLQDQIQIQGNNRSMNEVQPFLQKNFTSFTLPEKVDNYLQKAAPLNAPFGTYTLSPAVYTFLNQKIGKIDTEYPLWAVSDQSGQRNAYILGSGLWKWRLNEFSQNGNTAIFDDLIVKTIQYTTTKMDDRRLRINPSKSLFGPGETLLFTAEFYNDNNARINEPDVQLTIRDEANKEYPFAFSKQEDYYTLNAGSFQPGSYRFFGKTSWNRKEYTHEGRFNITSFNVEMENTTADHALLRNLSHLSSGASFSPEAWQLLRDLLHSNHLNKPTIHTNIVFNPLIDSKWIFIFVFLAFGLEWFLRRYWGSY